MLYLDVCTLYLQSSTSQVELKTESFVSTHIHASTILQYDAQVVHNETFWKFTIQYAFITITGAAVLAVEEG